VERYGRSGFPAGAFFAAGRALSAKQARGAGRWLSAEVLAVLARAGAVAPLLVTLLVAALAGAGCGGGGPRYESAEADFSMELPEGWRQGEPGGSGWREFSGGFYFYPDADNPETAGSVLDYPFEAETLAGYVDEMIQSDARMNETMIRMSEVAERLAGAKSPELEREREGLRTGVLTKRTLTVDGHEAVEVTLSQGPMRRLDLYIERSDEVVFLTFAAPEEVFEGYAAALRERYDTIEVD